MMKVFFYTLILLYAGSSKGLFSQSDVERKLSLIVSDIVSQIPDSNANIIIDSPVPVNIKDSTKLGKRILDDLVSGLLNYKQISILDTSLITEYIQLAINTRSGFFEKEINDFNFKIPDYKIKGTLFQEEKQVRLLIILVSMKNGKIVAGNKVYFPIGKEQIQPLVSQIKAGIIYSLMDIYGSTDEINIQLEVENIRPYLVHDLSFKEPSSISVVFNNQDIERKPIENLCHCSKLNGKLQQTSTEIPIDDFRFSLYGGRKIKFCSLFMKIKSLSDTRNLFYELELVVKKDETMEKIIFKKIISKK